MRKENDIVYGKRPLGPRVVGVVPNDDYTLTLTFTNGEVKVYDMNPLLDKGHISGTAKHRLFPLRSLKRRRNNRVAPRTRYLPRYAV